jgi:DNA-binding NarL/FixJ family response regulator
VDDHPIVREGIALVVQLETDMEVVGQATSADEAVAVFQKSHPDITLMDLKLGSTSGVSAIRSIRRLRGDARIIVLTMHSGDEDVRSAFAAGATTYLLKETLSSELVATIRSVHNGGRPLSATVLARLEAAASLPRLTRRETEVLRLVAEGRRNKEIATILGVSDDTVESHLKNVFVKLDVTDRTAAVNVAVRRGIVQIA